MTGVYALDPNLSVKANLSVNAKYKKGAKTPSGNTKFKAGDLNFEPAEFRRRARPRPG